MGLLAMKTDESKSFLKAVNTTKDGDGDENCDDTIESIHIDFADNGYIVTQIWASGEIKEVFEASESVLERLGGLL